MPIAPQNLTLRDLLHRRLFKIPAYQRPYSWQRKQRQALFADLQTVHEKQQEFHFMATVVGVRYGEMVPIGTDEYEQVDIVDGQQRLTTLILLLRAISLALPPGNSERRDLEAQLVMNDAHTLVLLQTNHDYNGYFIDYLRDGRKTDAETFDSAADANIVAAIRDAEAFVDRWERVLGVPLVELLKVLKNRLRFIFHLLEDEEIVYTVFEVLNARGLEVAYLDRCKAVLMGIAYESAENPEAMVGELQEIWRRIYEKVGLRQGLSSEPLRFAATLWAETPQSRVMPDEGALGVFREAAVEDPNLTIRISRFLEEVAGALDALLADQQKAAVTKIAHVRLLAVAIGLRFQGELRENLLAQWEHSSFRIFGLARRDSRSQVGNYVRLAREVYNSGGTRGEYAGFMQEMRGLAQERFSAREAAENLRNTDCYDGWQESLRYFFYARERWLQGQRGVPLAEAAWKKIWAESADRTIEHVLPQSPEAGSGWKEKLEEAGVQRADEICHRLGNMVVLPQAFNREASNSDFDEKRDIYRRAGLLISDEIADRERWTPETIEEREDELLKWAAGHWGDVPV